MLYSVCVSFESHCVPTRRNKGLMRVEGGTKKTTKNGCACRVRRRGARWFFVVIRSDRAFGLKVSEDAEVCIVAISFGKERCQGVADEAGLLHHQAEQAPPAQQDDGVRIWGGIKQGIGEAIKKKKR